MCGLGTQHPPLIFGGGMQEGWKGYFVKVTDQKKGLSASAAIYTEQLLATHRLQGMCCWEHLSHFRWNQSCYSWHFCIVVAPPCVVYMSSWLRVLVLLHSGCLVSLLSQFAFIRVHSSSACQMSSRTLLVKSAPPRTTVPLSRRDAQHLELLVVPMGSLSRPHRAQLYTHSSIFWPYEGADITRFEILRTWATSATPTPTTSGRSAERAFREWKWLWAELEYPWFTLNQCVVVH